MLLIPFRLKTLACIVAFLISAPLTLKANGSSLFTEEEAYEMSAALSSVAIVTAFKQAESCWRRAGLARTIADRRDSGVEQSEFIEYAGSDDVMVSMITNAYEFDGSPSDHANAVYDECSNLAMDNLLDSILNN